MNEQEIELSYSQPTTEQHKLTAGRAVADSTHPPNRLPSGFWVQAHRAPRELPSTRSLLVHQHGQHTYRYNRTTQRTLMEQGRHQHQDQALEVTTQGLNP
jgi:hypothetical protein